MENNTIHQLELREYLFPFSLLKGAQVFREMAIGEIMEVICDDPQDAEMLYRVLPPSTFRRMKSRVDETTGIVFMRIIKTANPEQPTETCDRMCAGKNENGME